jgi:hypothetical protein
VKGNYLIIWIAWAKMDEWMARKENGKASCHMGETLTYIV